MHACNMLWSSLHFPILSPLLVYPLPHFIVKPVRSINATCMSMVVGPPIAIWGVLEVCWRKLTLPLPTATNCESSSATAGISWLLPPSVLGFLLNSSLCRFLMNIVPAAITSHMHCSHMHRKLFCTELLSLILNDLSAPFSKMIPHPWNEKLCYKCSI